MPAEIDTGGPRVLHCDYRADCPIPIVVSASTESSLDHENRVIPLLRGSIVRGLPRIDENKLLANDIPAKSRSSSGLPCCRRGGTPIRSGLRGFRRASSIESSTTLNVPNDGDVAEQFYNKDTTQDISRPNQLESHFRDIAEDFEINLTIIENRSRNEPTFARDSTLRYRKIEAPSWRDSNSPHDSSEEQSWFSKTNLHGRNWSLFDTVDTTRVTIEKSPFSNHLAYRPSTENQIHGGDASNPVSFSTNETWNEIGATSSWKRDPCVDEIDFNDHRTEFLRSNESLRNSHTTRKSTRPCPKTLSYLQLAFLLFLVAFGQSGLLKSSVLNCSAKPSTTGLSVLAIGTVISAVSAAPVDLMGDAGVRAERSANLSHITGASRKIQMYIKNRHLQILPDGTVNGSNDDTSDYTIFQRTSVSRGQLRIQGVATCLYLCMDSCGLLYGSREYTEDCVFNETLEQHNYNTYSSVRWSTAKKTLYLGLNRRGQPRRVQAKGHNLGRLSAYARVLTQVAPPDRVEALQRRMLGAHHNVRHRHNNHGEHHHRSDVIQQSLCPTLPAQEKDGRDRFRCRKRKKRKKRKRRCRPGEKPGPQCQVPEEMSSSTTISVSRNEDVPPNGTSLESKRSCEGAASEEACRREALSVPSKKRKLRVEDLTTGGSSSRNVTSNGKNKPPASNAKKLNVTGSMSQSKKPNLTDGKKRKRKGSPMRRNPALTLARKRFAPGRTDNTSAVLTGTTAPTFAMSSSSWWSPGASTVPSGRGISPRRRAKAPSFPTNESNSSNGSSERTVSPRRVGKAFAKNRTTSIAKVTTTSAYETTITPDQSDRLLAVKVPETLSDRSFRRLNLSSLDVSEVSEDVSRSLSDSSSRDEESFSTVSNERATSTLDTTVVTTIEATTAPTIFRLAEEESRSIEDDDDDDVDDSGRFDTPETIQSTTPRFPLERLAM